MGHKIAANVAIRIVALLWIVPILLVRIVPRSASVWEELGEPLTPFQRTLFMMSNFFANHWWLFIMLLVPATIAVIVWKIKLARTIGHQEDV